MATDDDYTPTLQCITDGNGKGLVNASVGLITEDELIYAGMTLRGSSPEFYFASQSWIMSPAGFDSVAKIWDSYCGSFDIKEADDYEWFHPVINLKSDTKALYDASTGTYIVE